MPTIRFRFKGLEGFYPDIREAIADNPAVLAGFVLAEIDYKVSELDEQIKLAQHGETELQDYLSWLTSQGAEGQYPAQILLSDTPVRRKAWAQRHIDPAAIAEQITAMPDAMLTEFHPALDVWSHKTQCGVPIETVVTCCANCYEPIISAPGLCPVCERHVEYPTAGNRLYPFHQRLDTGDVVVLNILMAAIDPQASIGRLGYWSYPVRCKPPADILTLTRLLFDRGSDLEVAYLKDRIEIFHKTPDTEQEKAAKLLVSFGIPTSETPNPLPPGTLPEGSPTAFDLPCSQVMDDATGILSMLTKLSSSSEPTMEEALAFQDAVHRMVGKPKDE
ncbi:MAG: hypothetical protein WC869_00135 [Phycisphaerae bacterium]|jgi:hypothetical protein